MCLFSTEMDDHFGREVIVSNVSSMFQTKQSLVDNNNNLAISKLSSSYAESFISYIITDVKQQWMSSEFGEVIT